MLRTGQQTKGLAQRPRSATTPFILLARQLLAYLISLALALPAPLVASTIIWSGVANAQTYNEGYSKYQKGDMQGAERALVEAVRKDPPRAEKAKAYLLLGVVKFNLGNNNAAATNFRNALLLNPASDVNNLALLDDAVVPFFNSQKAKMPKPAAKGAKPTAKSVKPAAKRVAAPKKAPPQPPPGPAKNAAGGLKNVQKTLLTVKSNIPGAQVWLDGIILGPVNVQQEISEPGTLLVEVQAPGYPARRANVKVISGRDNVVTINLEKPKPKVKPKPKPAPKPQAPAAPVVAGGGKAPKAKAKKRRKKADLYAPTPDDDFSSGPRRDLENEFAMDAQGGGYQQAPAYGPAPAYGAPAPYGYAPAPMVYAPPPPPVYYAPPPPPTPPPPAPLPGGDPYAGGYVDPAAPPDPAAAPELAPEGESGRKGGGRNSTFIAILPFGAGQFQNRSYLLGTLFLGAEVGSLYLWNSKNQAADKVVAETNAYVASQKQEDLDQMSDTDRAAYDKFIADRKKYVTDTRQQAQLFLGAFIGLWAVGAIEAILNEKKPTPTKKAKKRKYRGFTYDPAGRGTPDYRLVDSDTFRHDKLAFAWDLTIMPTPSFSVPLTPEANEPGVGLALTWSF